MIAVIVVMGSIGGISYMSNESRGGAINEHALYPVSTVGTQRFADFEAATRLANQVRPEGTAVFVIGNAHEWWHEQLWAPGIANGTYYYDDWLWYWHVDQPGPYHPDRGYWMPNPTNALTMEYFWQHGIGVVMVSDMPVADGIPPRQAAANTPSLELVESFGSWDVYRVLPQASIATRGDALPESVRVQNGRITASFPEGTGDILVRQNWFPRWNAIVNGKPASVARSPEGYMLIGAQDGAVEFVLEYGVTTSDWIARAASVTGVIGTALFAWRGSRLRTGEINPNEG